MNKQKILAAVVVIAAVVLPALGVWLYKGRYLPKYAPPAATSTLSDAPELASYFETDSGTISLILEEPPSPDLSAVSLQILFEPKFIKVNKVKTGDIFGSINLLQNEIDNVNGEIRLAFGKGFENKEIIGKTVAMIEFISLDDNEVSMFQLGSGSIASFVGEEASVPFFAPTLFLNSTGDELIDFIPETNGTDY